MNSANWGLAAALGAMGGMVLGAGLAWWASAPKTSATLDATSLAIQESADACLLAVRDQGTKYEETAECTALSALATRYIEAANHNTNPTYELRFMTAQRMAWTALALSEGRSGCRRRGQVRIW